MTRFAILTDIHLGPEGHFNGVLRKMNKDAKIFLDDFVEEMNTNVKPEFTVVPSLVQVSMPEQRKFFCKYTYIY